MLFRSASVRGCDNQPLPVQPGDPAQLVVSHASPIGIADLAASALTSGNDTSGRTRIQITWTPPVAGRVELYRAPFGSYPGYDNGGGTAPDPSTAPGGVWSVVSTDATSRLLDVPPSRGFWHYVAFVVDSCLNRSLVSNMTSGALDYALSMALPRDVVASLGPAGALAANTLADRQGNVPVDLLIGGNARAPRVALDAKAMAAVEIDENDPSGSFRTALRAYCRIVHRYRGHIRLLYRELDALSPEVQAVAEQLDALFARLHQPGAARGGRASRRRRDRARERGARARRAGEALPHSAQGARPGGGRRAGDADAQIGRAHV